MTEPGVMIWTGMGLSHDHGPVFAGAAEALTTVEPGRLIELTVSFADGAPQTTGSERALSYKDWNAGRILAEYRIPRHLHGGIERYLKDHIRAGDFLMAIMRNDCADAMVRASDASAILAVRHIVQFLNAEVSQVAWGTPGRVDAWLALRAPAVEP